MAFLGGRRWGRFERCGRVVIRRGFGDDELILAIGTLGFLTAPLGFAFKGVVAHRTFEGYFHFFPHDFMDNLFTDYPEKIVSYTTFAKTTQK